MDTKILEEQLMKEGIVFLIYGSFLTQPLIVGMTDALEKEAESKDLSKRVSNNIFSIFIELAQNMMNYANSKLKSDMDYYSKAFVIVGINPQENQYYILSRNMIDPTDRKIIEDRLSDLKGLNKEQLRKLYREKRKKGSDKHEHGAGIGFIEIAKCCDSLEYSFEPCEDNRYYFTIKTIIKNER